jgi:hypothetical protein
VETPEQPHTVPHQTKGPTRVPSSNHPLLTHRVASARRPFLLVALTGAAFAMASPLGHFSGASAQPVQNEGITIDCRLGAAIVRFVAPPAVGTTVLLMK